MDSPGSNYLKSVVYLTNNLSPGVGGAPSWKLYLKNGMVEKVFNRGDGFPRVKLPKLSHLFDNNVSPSVGDLLSQKPISQEQCGRKFFRQRSYVQHMQMSQNQLFI
jgi:hypothetical protein